jgi:hypothetical protein
MMRNTLPPLASNDLFDIAMRWISLDLLCMNFLSVNTAIGITGHVARSITRKRDASEVIFEEKRLPTGRKTLVCIPTHLRPQFPVFHNDVIRRARTPFILAHVVLIDSVLAMPGL